MKFFFVLLLIFQAGYFTSYSQKKYSPTPGERQVLDSIATQDVPKSAPGIATGIVSNGQIVYEKVAGYADLADSTFITKNSRFNIASNGKQFTALAILMLHDEGKISLNDDIRKYLPGIYVDLKMKISVENLLNHSSGIRDVYDLWSLQGLTWWKQSYNNKDALALIEKQQDLNFKPGSRYLYSNSNYILLALIIEKITGKSFIAYTNDLFKKLKMYNTSFEDDHTKIRGPIAKAYFNFNTWTTYNWIWNVYGDGNIFSTLADQLQWEQILQGKKITGVKKQILNKSQLLTANSTVQNYGYGLEFGTYKGFAYKFHEGATGAWKATVIRFPGRNISILTLTNTGKATPNTQTRQMADVVLQLKNNTPTYLTKPAKAGDFISDEDIVGIYQTENNFTFDFEKRDSFLYLKRFGRNDVKLEREAANIFRQTYDPDFKQEFKKTATGEMLVTAYYTSHSPYSLTKLTSKWGDYDYQSINGRFLNTETNTIVEINYLANKNYSVKIGNQDSTKGLLVSPNKILVGNYVIDFQKESGTTTVLLLSANRIQNVRFIRED